MEMLSQLTGLLGVAALLGTAWFASSDRRRISWRIVVAGVGLQFVVAAMVLHVPVTRWVFDGLARGVVSVLGFAEAGSSFVFGGLGGGDGGGIGFIFAFRVLPIIVFFSALMGALYHMGVMQRLIGWLAWVFRRTLGVSGEEALAAAANVFVGQTEAPLCIRPYLARLTMSQLNLVMTTGFATIAGSVLLGYVGVLGGDDPSRQELFAKHLLGASLMSAPGAFVIAKMLLPESGPVDASAVRAVEVERSSNILDALTGGASEGLKLALNVGAMLIAFVSLIALVDGALGLASRLPWIDAAARWAGVEAFSLDVLLGWVFSPVAWLMGVGLADAGAVGSLMGTQVVATEFIAYRELGLMVEAGSISPRSQQIAAYALCGFCNFASIGIQVGGLAALAPERRADLARLGFRAMCGGAMACWMTGAIAGVLVG